jgi:hypothetical protein
MPLDRSRRSFIANGALTSAIVLAGQAIGWPEAAIAQGVGKETRSNFTTSNDTRTITSTSWSARSVAAHGRSWWPSRDGVKTRTATDRTTGALTPMW